MMDVKVNAWVVFFVMMGVWVVFHQYVWKRLIRRFNQLHKVEQEREREREKRDEERVRRYFSSDRVIRTRDLSGFK